MTRRSALCLRAAAVLLLLAAPCPVSHARDAHSVGEWLGGKAFCAPGIALALDQDGFFALRMAADAKRPVQNVTGLWRLAQDGIDLTLFNHQDAEIRLTVGRDGLHGSLGDSGQVLLTRACEPDLHFRVTGILRRSPEGFHLSDASSGRNFAIVPDPLATPDRFATADVEFTNGFVKPGLLIRHSAPVPRFFTPRAQTPSLDLFKNAVQGKYWLLPPDLSSEQAALHFGEASRNGRGEYEGNFDITGRGIRLDGTYLLNGGNLTLTASRASLRNLEILGLKALAKQMKGQFSWRLTSRGLEFTGNGASFRMLAQ